MKQLSDDKRVQPLPIAEVRAKIEQKKTRLINVSEIERNDSRQPRTGIDKAYVAELRELISDGAALPAVTVFSDTGNAPYFLADGWHRLEGTAALSLKQILAEVKIGGSHEAFLHSLGANNDHGKRRTNDDKRRAVNLALDEERTAGLSDRAIASLCVVSHVLVSDIRKEREKQSTGSSSSSTDEKKPETPKTRVGQDGKKRPAAKPKKTPPEKPDTKEPVPIAPNVTTGQGLSEDGKEEHVDDVTGEVSTCQGCIQKAIIIKKHEGHIRGLNLKIAELQADEDEKMKKAPRHSEFVVLFEFWKRTCGHPRSKQDAARYKNVASFLKDEGFETCARAIAGKAHEKANPAPFQRDSKIHDDWELIFRDRKHFERLVNLAPANWKELYKWESK